MRHAAPWVLAVVAQAAAQGAVRAEAALEPGRAGSVLVQLQAEPATTPLRADFAERWMERDGELVLRLADAQVQARWRTWRWFVGTQEVTALARLAEPGVVALQPGSAAPWPAGERELVVRDGTSGQEVARFALRVLNAAGLQSSELTQRRLDVGSEGRGADRRSDGQPTSPRTGQAAGSTGLGAAWKGRRDAWALEAAANLAGHSQRESALRYGQLGAQAPKLDLADFRAALSWHDHQQLEFGHLSAGNHPLLAASFASRGVGARARLAPETDIAVHALRGSAIVGWDDLSGLQEEDHRQHLLTLGTELVPTRPGALRAEFSLLDATLRPIAAFNAGTVADAEQSRGAGLRLVGGSADGRLGGEIAWAHTRHTHPFDPELAQDGNLVPVRTSQANALLAALRWGLLRQETTQLDLEARYERNAPQYRSPAAGVSPDQEASRLALQAMIDGAAARLQASTRVDNLDRVATLLRTRTDEYSGNLTLPLATWLAPPAAVAQAEAPATTATTATTATSAAGLSPWPALSLNLRRTHQRAVNEPRPEDSGIAATHRPDQIDTEQQLQLSWTLGTHSLSYGITRGEVDNRQPGRERADFHRLAHQGSVNAQLAERWRAALSLARTRSLSTESGLISRNVGGALQLDWQASERWALAASLRHDLADDSADRARLAGDGAQLQLTHRFGLPGWEGSKLPGQWFLRLGYEAQRQRDNVFGTAAAFRAAWVDWGLSLSFF